MKTKIIFAVAVFASILLVGCSNIANIDKSRQIAINVTTADVDISDVPVCVDIKIPKDFAQLPAEQIVVNMQQKGKNISIPGQVITADGKTHLWWIIPSAGANTRARWIASFAHQPEAAGGFKWQDRAGEYLDLLYDGRKIIRYQYAYDTSEPNIAHQTYKPFHHVFDETGENIITKGHGGLYTHHRGIFLGWNKLKFQDNRYDTWHMMPGEGKFGSAQIHKNFASQTAGPVLAQADAVIDWINRNNEHILREHRKVTVFRQPDPAIALLQFDIELEAQKSDVLLDGDPEHGGFQYRPHNDVARECDRAKKQATGDYEDVKAAYLFHEEGINPRSDLNLPWVEMSYGLNGKRYNVQHMNHPDNPKPTIYSAYRDYGRFGAYFRKEIPAGQTLKISYRIWITNGPAPCRELLDLQYKGFSQPPTVELIN